MEKQERGVYDYRTDAENKMCLVRWNDNKVVTCATNFDSLEERSCGQRSIKEKYTFLNQKYLPTTTNTWGCR